MTYFDENLKTENSDTSSVRNKSVYLTRGSNNRNEYYVINHKLEFYIS